MKINMDVLKALELKLAEYSKENGAIAEHVASNANCYNCHGGGCTGDCVGSCYHSCSGSCSSSKR